MGFIFTYTLDMLHLQFKPATNKIAPISKQSQLTTVFLCGEGGGKQMKRQNIHFLFDKIEDL